MQKVLRIFYVGSLDPKSNSYGRFKALAAMGHDVTGIDIDPFIMHTIFSSIHYRLNIGPGIWKLNKEVRKAVISARPDLLLVDNKPFLTRSTLNSLRLAIPGMKLANLITDDPTGNHKMAWRICLHTASLYDIHFVQRQVNIKELISYGANRVDICHRSFDPSFHRRISFSHDEQLAYHCPVGFIGTHEEQREEYIVYLINQGIQVQVTGNDWPNKKYWDVIKPYYRGPSTYGEEYVKVINGMDIALHFLRHGNRDEQDSRTFEIPACGSFMLAESSELHRQLFTDGREAVFFSTKEELLGKVKYYLDHPDERKQIADAGMKRCHESMYTHEGRLRAVIKKIQDL